MSMSNTAPVGTIVLTNEELQTLRLSQPECPDCGGPCLKTMNTRCPGGAGCRAGAATNLRELLLVLTNAPGGQFSRVYRPHGGFYLGRDGGRGDPRSPVGHY